MRQGGTKKWTLVGVLVIAGGFLTSETLAWVWTQALDWLRANWSDIPWSQLVGAVALFAAVVIAFWPREKRSEPAPPPSREARLAVIFQGGKKLTDIIVKQRRLPSFMREHSINPTTLAANAESLFLSLEKIDFPTPRRYGDVSAESYLAGAEAYFSALCPLIRDGHVAEAEATAEEMMEGLGKEMRSFDPHLWFQNRY